MGKDSSGGSGSGLSDEGEMPSVYSMRNPKARKEHKCCECRGTIFVGEKYYLVFGVWDGSASTFKTCADCQQLREYLMNVVYRSIGCHVPFGEMYDDVFKGDPALVHQYMDIRRQRNAPPSPQQWMEKREAALSL